MRLISKLEKTIMGNSDATYWQRIQSLPVIRRVIRKGGNHLCGICRTEYGDYREAYGCLDECWRDVLTLSPIVTKKILGSGTQYRCRFCSRDYNTESFARQCASDCRQKQQRMHEQEAHLSSPPDRQKRRAARPASTGKQPVRLVPRGAPAASAPRSGFGRQEKEAVSAHLSAMASSLAAIDPSAISGGGDMDVDIGGVDPAPPEATAKGRAKAEFKEKFVRKNAKYACRFCNVEYFTKVEVEQCFDGHFDANGVAIKTT